MKRWTRYATGDLLKTVVEKGSNDILMVRHAEREIRRRNKRRAKWGDRTL